jgi:hypothetical protein
MKIPMENVKIFLTELAEECEKTINLIKNTNEINDDLDKEGSLYANLSLAVTNLNIKSGLMENYLDELISEIDEKQNQKDGE